MLARCTYESADRFARYGAREIKVCDRWRESFEAFFADVGPVPSSKHSLARVCNDGPYEPGNVEWQTIAQQSRNTSRNRLLTLNGRTMTIGDWASLLDINRQTIQMRIDKYGWTIERALMK